MFLGAEIGFMSKAEIAAGGTLIQTDTGWLSAGSTSQLSDGDTAWSNRGNAASSNNVYMTASLGSGTKSTHTGLFTNFAASIPSGATITGVAVQAERKASNNTRGKDQTVQLIIGGSQAGDNKANATAYTTSDVTVSYGGAGDLWSNAISQAQAIASDFGVAFRSNNNANGTSTISIDMVQLKIFYEYYA